MTISVLPCAVEYGTQGFCIYNIYVYIYIYISIYGTQGMYIYI